jgi:Fuc2NAc and GlcNAc transferase
MLSDVEMIVAGSFAASALLTGAVRRISLSRGILDRPNERSSHESPTPRGGGLAIAVVSMLAILILYVIGSLDRHAMVALVGGGIAVAGVGFVDDRRPLAAWVRLLVHLGAALWALMWLGGLPILSFGHSLLALGAMGYLLGVFGTTWALNLFNFMDGIDGLAASEAVFMAWAGAWLTFRWGGGGALIGVGLALGAASLGFLLWNWPPAKIFRRWERLSRLRHCGAGDRQCATE